MISEVFISGVRSFAPSPIASQHHIQVVVPWVFAATSPAVWIAVSLPKLRDRI